MTLARWCRAAFAHRPPALCALLMLAVVSACTPDVASPGDAGSTAGPDGGTAGDGGPDAVDAGPQPCAPDAGPEDTDDVLPPGRVLRRASMVLRGTPPLPAEYDALFALEGEEARRAHVAQFIDTALADPAFYTVLFEMGRDWFNLPLVARTADAPEYGLIQQRALRRCADDTPHAGKWVYHRGNTSACTDPDAPARTIEPWWAPGTTTILLGHAASTAETGEGRRNGSPITIVCAEAGPSGTCGCGPNAALCNANFQRYPGWEDYLPTSGESHRRLMSEEPARLFAHIAWHDRPASDLITGTYMVGTTTTQSAYVMQAAAGGSIAGLSDPAWWNPAAFADAPHDPLHTADDPWAWREFDLPTRLPFLLAARDTTYDPRLTDAPLAGVPAAGVLTSLGVLASWPRERLRGARLLEVLGCEVFSPPTPDQVFNTYVDDPGTQGTCQHCHRRIDPAAMHFKRFAKSGNAVEGHGAKYFMPGIGARWHWDNWIAGNWPYTAEPFTHWRRWYTADTAMTPVTQAQIDANPEVVFLDFLPPDQTLLGQVSDGTVGPLGFGKLLIGSGAFDRCMVRQVHKLALGRDIDRATEAGYHDALTAYFVDHDRNVRTLVRHLMNSALFQRGL